MKKIISLILSFVLILSLILPFSLVAAAEDYYSDNSIYFDDSADADNISDIQRTDLASRFLNPQNIIISLIAGAVIGLIAVSVMKSKLISVHKQDSAANYAVRGSLIISEQSDKAVSSNTYSVQKYKPVENNK